MVGEQQRLFKTKKITMKNIHILPTDKPSRLVRNGEKLLLVEIPKRYSFFGNTINININITSDEEIKEGDYYIHGNRLHKHLGKKCLDVLTNKEYSQSKLINKDTVFKKIILTTDQDLIGIQAIDDEFLEWFVKNPSCDEVEVLRCPIEGLYTIISKEEPTQECECTDECLGYLTKECKRIEEPKQETLEEAAKRTYSDKLYPMYGGLRRDAFINGAKWQQEQLCNSEIIQRIRATKSDAEARRIIKSI